jgi:WD40 repeat protein
LRPFYLDYYLTISPNVSSALYNHMMTKIFVGHSNGSISVIKLEAEKNSLEEEDEDKGEADGKDKKVKKKDLNGLDTQVLGPFHTKAVTLVKELTSAPVLLSAGRDGNVIFWSLANSKYFA